MTSTNYLPCDLFKMILNMRSYEMKNDKYKSNYNKVINEINMINAIIIKDGDFNLSDNDKYDNYNYNDFKGDILDDYLRADFFNDYYENKISYDDFKNEIIQAVDQGLYFYDVNKTCIIDDLSYIYLIYNDLHPHHKYQNKAVYDKHFKTYFNDYDDDLNNFFINNEKVIFNILKKVLNYRDNDFIDEIRNILNVKDYKLICQM